MIEILTAINLWCAPADLDPELFSHCRQTLNRCAQDDLKKHGALTVDTLKCFEKVDKEILDDLDLSQVGSSGEKKA